MKTLRTLLVAAAVLTITSVACAQVRIIGPDSEHVYSSDPREAGRLLDDEALQRENERRERAKIERQREREDARRREELDAAEAARAAAGAYADQPQIGSTDVGTFGIQHRRHIIARRPGTTGAVSGNSWPRTHTNARALR
jgi:thiamine pyrophosphate-dependent acetolactate synthase large subunit-like protein